MLILMITTVVIWGLGGLIINPIPAYAVTAGDLIKAPDSSAVYYVGPNNQKYVFPSEQVYLSWFPDFSWVNTVTAETLQSYETIGNVVMRPGTKLIQFVTINADGTMYVDDPKVYALEPNGVRRWITTAYLAQQLYGNNWETKIFGCPNYLISNYPEGPAITTAIYPEGTIVKQAGTADVYYINDAGQKQHLTFEGYSANMFRDEFVITTSLSLENYPIGSAINATIPELTSVISGAPVAQPAHVYYVATNGSDNNAGTLISPFRTISKATQVAQAGDIIYIRQGTYDETVIPPNSGTENNYITFTSYPGETVIVRGTGGFGFYLSNVDYIKIDNLKIMRGVAGEGRVLPEYEPYKSTAYAHGAGIKLFFSDYNLITNNEIYDNNIGIFVSEGGYDVNNTYPSIGNQIINNIIHHNGEAGIRVKRSDETIIDNNTIYNNGLKTNNVYDEPTSGIVYYCTEGITITNNVIYGNSEHAIQNYAGTSQGTCDAANTLMKNNILSQTSVSPITDRVYSGKKIVLSIAEIEAVDNSHIYDYNTFYNGSIGSEIVVWGVNNTFTIGENLTLLEFNALANNLNSESGIGNIEVSTNPIQ